MLCFDFIDLFAESRLGDVQPVGGPSEIQLLGQHIDCTQVTHFDPREHGSHSVRRAAEISPATSSEGTGGVEKVSE
jgi:hypothetical protein